MRKDDKLVSFSEDMECLVEWIKAHWDGCDSIKPKGYNKFLQDYTDFQGMAEMDTKSIHEAFRGMDDSSTTSFPFPIKTSLSHVAYDDVCQGRDPLHVLMAACVSYGMARGLLWTKEKIAKGVEAPLLSIHKDVKYIKEIIKNMEY